MVSIPSSKSHTHDLHSHMLQQRSKFESQKRLKCVIETCNFDLLLFKKKEEEGEL